MNTATVLATKLIGHLSLGSAIAADSLLMLKDALAKKGEYEEMDEVGPFTVVCDLSTMRYYVNRTFELNQDNHAAGPFQTEEQAYSWALSNR